MRRWVIIGTLVLVYLVCGSRSCTEGDSAREATQLARIEACQDSVIRQFNKERLSGLDLAIFEEAAVQKLGEWSDCMKMALDTSLSPAFREQARVYAGSLFLSPDEAMEMQDAANLWGNLTPDTLTTGKNLTGINDSLFIGSLNCRWIKTDPAGNNPVIPGRTIPFCVARTTRVFGTDTVRYWNAFLGANRK